MLQEEMCEVDGKRLHSDTCEEDENSTETDFKEKEENWITGVFALNLTRKALCEVIGWKWKTFISNMKADEKKHLATFVKCLEERKILHFEIKVTKLDCHSLCEALFTRLLLLQIDPLAFEDSVNDWVPSPIENDNASKSKLHHDVGEESTRDIHSVPIYNANDGEGSLEEIVEPNAAMKSKDEVKISPSDYYWDIAKLFKCDGSKNGLRCLDISQVIRMMVSCKLFACDESEQLFHDVLEGRNELMHSTKNYMTTERIVLLLEHMEELLAQFTESGVKECEDTLSIIKLVKTSKLFEEDDQHKQYLQSCLLMKKDAIDFDIFLCNTIRTKLSKTKSNSLKIILDDTLKKLQELDDSNQTTQNEEMERLRQENELLKQDNEEALLENDEIMDLISKNKTLKEKIRWFELERTNATATIKRLEKIIKDKSKSNGSPDTASVKGFTILHEIKLFHGQKLTVVEGDIVKVTADAIVHPTNSHFSMSGKVGKGLAKVGGVDLQKEVHALQSCHGVLDTSAVAICEGKNCLAKYVIHVNSPFWQSDNAQHMLDTAAHNVLKLADDTDISSIAIPSISSGNAGFPKVAAAEIILQAVRNHFQSNTGSSIKQVYFVLHDAESVTAYITELKKFYP